MKLDFAPSKLSRLESAGKDAIKQQQQQQQQQRRSELDVANILHESRRKREQTTVPAAALNLLSISGQPGSIDANPNRQNFNSSAASKSAAVAGSSNVAEGGLKATGIHWEIVDETERVLRRFDTDPTYGPASGMSRIARWKRAESLGLDPPMAIKMILSSPQYANSTSYVAGL
ncbi:hypothetical protein GQ42DRAFT_162160 [Ramicandelaber brevisporus]|nr:hypothetical protein GQ42DRAFT_162160 [Ramicandelaber brevisporus]